MKPLLVLLILCASTLSAETLRFSTQDQEGPGVEMVTAILKEAYGRLGYEIQVVYEPLDRSIVDANAGRFDGDLFRGGEIQSRYPNLILVPVPLVRSEIVVFTKNVTFPLTSWSSLAPYQITTLRGYQGVLGPLSPTKLTLISSWDQVFRMLDAERAELVIAPKLTGTIVVSQLGLKNIRILGRPLETVEVFHYLHVKRSGLVGPLTATLRSMTAEGFLAKVYEEVVKRASDQRPFE